MAERWVIVGAGAVGGTIGGRLHQGGADVVFVARGEHGAALQRDGLLLRDPDGEARVHVPTVSTPGEVDWRPGDVAIVATKTQDLVAALDAIAAAAPDVPVVCATNGLEAERLALRRFPEVHGICLWLPAQHVEPGVVETSSAPCSGVLDVGRYPAGTDEVDEALAAALSAGQFVSTPVDDVMAAKRTKLLSNLGNVLDAACGEDPGLGPIIKAARREARAAFAAADLPLVPREEADARWGGHVQVRPVGDGTWVGGSTAQSLWRGMRLETDYLNGEIVLLGRLHGVPTPVNEGLQRLGRALETSGARPGAMSAAEVAALLNLDLDDEDGR